MKEINIARAIVRGRRARGITQRELADYMGVSKASVSKWETGQSYPDITFLPKLATYFNISVDELIGYEPQMTKEEIRQLYHKLSADFSKLPFAAVMSTCQEIIRKYYSCFPLLLQMCVLLINHVHLAETEELQVQIKTAVRDLCIRIKNESLDVDLSKQANFIEAFCELSLGNPKTVIDLMEGVNDPLLSEEVILASAYYLTGNIHKAKETTQVGIFRHLMGIFGDIPNYLMLNTDDYNKYDQIMTRVLGLIELFDVERLHPVILFGIYLTGAQGYAMLEDDERALDLLQRYVDLATADIYPIVFSGDQFFDKVDDWLSDLALGVKPPQNEAVIRGSMVDGLTKNPAFNRLAENYRFKNMVERLEKSVEERGD